jgi:hypothetical protein
MTTAIVLGSETLKETGFDACAIERNARRIQMLLEKRVIDENVANKIEGNIDGIKYHINRLADWSEHWNKMIKEVV